MNREDDIRHDFIHTVSVERIEAGLDKSRQGRRVAASQRRPTIGSTFVAGAKHRLPFELGMGLVDMPFEIANIQLRKSGGHRAHPDRLVPLGVEHSARVRRSSHGRRDRAADRARPKEMLLELIGRRGIVDLGSVKDLWDYGEPY